MACTVTPIHVHTIACHTLSVIQLYYYTASIPFPGEGIEQRAYISPSSPDRATPLLLKANIIHLYNAENRMHG